MTWEEISTLHGKKFRRITGVYRSVFEEMVCCVEGTKMKERKHPTRGNSFKLSVENQVLMTVLYWREYRSQERLGMDFQISQPRVSRTIKEIETILIKDSSFHVAGKRTLTSPEAYEAVIVDVTETNTERPKKNKSADIVAKRNGTP